MSREWIGRLGAARVMPIVSVGDVDAATALVDDLVAGGAEAIEILLRSPRAPEVLRLCRRRHPEVLLAAGTVINAAGVGLAVEAGADVMISPGLTPALAAAALSSPLPLVPGVQTAGDVMLAAEYGLDVLKFYPAEPNDAATILKDYANVFPGTLFVPTGGIGEAALPKYASLRNVLAVGGSWLHAGLLPGATRPAALSRNMSEARRLLGAAVAGDGL
ncbi:bifunctional 4-hydroxy-2-oxoglutarate aldolase/2-dehydro-3-deoxy-phosphogluconate aldolase [Chelatococcus asaccharovorans]|uniref:2-keto-3-deoxy-phosphogluconate aldolase n=1 Tax=Chelatococcus asaccharovorans TaxID=28210 RepID=A0A2V3U3V3_9HYPH|nr:bifunctional 4-hydroxy-2-oxoglutarate aldolase/2-dehydro-3-deoxy-phosphogluconate aldolase [Chelatococcus asaccharovorans]MBS7702881.1 bifunctional 4-hydroxy-2-oxoglutarate aldolase/2-dehydro-3-deoxy-phosphogluconate aldolase [Chelatococcus asaccharovorans]PXW57181.1 2-keto-3-deoxy-phosphogluconate aldolase [Chelatococcus asaccharovorans]